MREEGQKSVFNILWLRENIFSYAGRKALLATELFVVLVSTVSFHLLGTDYSFLNLSKEQS